MPEPNPPGQSGGGLTPWSEQPAGSLGGWSQEEVHAAAPQQPPLELQDTQSGARDPGQHDAALAGGEPGAWHSGQSETPQRGGWAGPAQEPPKPSSAPEAGGYQSYDSNYPGSDHSREQARVSWPGNRRRGAVTGNGPGVPGEPYNGWICSYSPGGRRGGKGYGFIECEQVDGNVWFDTWDLPESLKWMPPKQVLNNVIHFMVRWSDRDGRRQAHNIEVDPPVSAIYKNKARQRGEVGRDQPPTPPPSAPASPSEAAGAPQPQQADLAGVQEPPPAGGAWVLLPTGPRTPQAKARAGGPRLPAPLAGSIEVAAEAPGPGTALAQGLGADDASPSSAPQPQTPTRAFGVNGVFFFA